MSASRHVTIWCDAEGCTNWHDAGSPTVTGARLKARMDGWRTALPDRTRPAGNNPQHDFCPDHPKAAS